MTKKRGGKDLPGPQKIEKEEPVGAMKSLDMRLDEQDEILKRLLSGQITIMNALSSQAEQIVRLQAEVGALTQAVAELPRSRQDGLLAKLTEQLIQMAMVNRGECDAANRRQAQEPDFWGSGDQVEQGEPAEDDPWDPAGHQTMPAP